MENQNQMSTERYLSKIKGILDTQQQLNNCFRNSINEINERENRASKSVFKNSIIILVFFFIDFLCLSFFIYDLQSKYVNQNKELNTIKMELVTLRNQIKNGK